MTLSRLIIVLAILLLPISAFGQAQYSADQVVRHFSQTKQPAAVPGCPEGARCLPKPLTRSVCSGTASICGDNSAAEPTQAEGSGSASADPGGFDLLVKFDLGSDRLSEQAQDNLREFARAMRDPKLKDMTFDIDGHTDARGSDALNDALSQRRARAVVEFLESLGIDRSRMQAHGYGKTRPRVEDPFAAINRRVEATISTE